MFENIRGKVSEKKEKKESVKKVEKAMKEEEYKEEARQIAEKYNVSFKDALEYVKQVKHKEGVSERGQKLGAGAKRVISTLSEYKPIAQQQREKFLKGMQPPQGGGAQGPGMSPPSGEKGNTGFGINVPSSEELIFGKKSRKKTKK